MPTINPPFRFDPFQMPVNMNWGAAGACVIVSTAAQIFYANDPAQWHEFDIAPTFDTVESGNLGAPIWRYHLGGVTCDLLHKAFWYAAPHPLAPPNIVDMYALPTPDISGGWSLSVTFTVPYSSPGPEYWVNTGFLNAYGGPFGAPTNDGGGPWTIDGGHTWDLAHVPPAYLQAGFQFPASKWNDLYLQQNSSEPSPLENGVLSDAHGNHPIPVNVPSGWRVLTNNIAAGNGVIVAILQSTAGQFRVGVTTDNQTWKFLDQIGSIPSQTPNPYPNPGPFRTGTSSPFFNFQTAVLTFVPNFGPPDPHSTGGSGLFVFAGSEAVTVPYTWWGDSGGSPAQFTTGAMMALPLQIYTSPDGINWTKRFQASYTNQTFPPYARNGPPPVFTDVYKVLMNPPYSHRVDWPFAPFAGKLYDDLGPSDGGWIPHDPAGAVPGDPAIGFDYQGTGFTDATRTARTWDAWWASANTGAADNGYSLSGSLPGTVTAKFFSPPNYLYLNPFSVPAGYYGDQTFTYSSVFYYRAWAYADISGGVIGTIGPSMQPLSIAASGYSFPILPPPT